MNTPVFCLTTFLRLSSASARASAGSRMNTECLRCLSTFRLLHLARVLHCATLALLYFSLKPREVVRHERQTHARRTNTGIGGCLTFCNLLRHVRHLLRQKGPL